MSEKPQRSLPRSLVCQDCTEAVVFTTSEEEIKVFCKTMRQIVYNADDPRLIVLTCNALNRKS